MHPPQHAQAMLMRRLSPLPAQLAPPGSALGQVLAVPVLAAHDHPAADNSAMDGYAASSRDLKQLPARLLVRGEATVRQPWPHPVAAGTAVAINTGAALPAGADTILPVEDTTRSEDAIEVHAARPGAFIRRRGGELRAGEVVLPAGARLNPAALGLLCGLGVRQIEVRPRPRVTLLITGEEFGDASRPDANGPMLTALCAAQGASVVACHHLPDSTEGLRDAIQGALDGSDVILSTGGASVGPHDHVGRAWDALRVDALFHRVAMKPGKPTHAGLLDAGPRAVLLLALPGNPLSALTTFELFVSPALDALQGRPHHGSGDWRPLAQPLRLGSRAQFLRVALEGANTSPRVRADPSWNSAMLRQAALSEHVAYLPPGEGVLDAGTDVWVTPWAGAAWPDPPPSAPR